MVWPLALSRVTRSTWMHHFLRYTVVTLPSRSWKWPRTIITSSSRRIGSERTLYFVRKSLLNGQLMIFLRTLEGAVKCALRVLLRELLTVVENFMMAWLQRQGGGGRRDGA